MRTLIRALPVAVLASMAMSASALEAAPAITTGTYVGDGSPTRIIEGGYLHETDVVLIKSENAGEAAVIALSSAPASTAKELGDNDEIFGDAILSLDPGGFTIGDRNHVNKSGERFHWMVIDADGLDSSVGFYFGNGAPTNTITGLGFQPDYVLVIPGTNDRAVHRTADMPASFALDDTGLLPDLITAFLPDGFEVGSDPSVNTFGLPYYVLAMKRSEGFFDFGSYTGDDSDDRDEPMGTIDPSFMFTKRNQSSRAPIRFGHQNYDECLEFDQGPLNTNRLQDMLDNQFQIGSFPSVNFAGDTYYWASWGTSRPLDLSVQKTVDDAAPAELDIVNYEVVVENLGPADGTGIWISDPLPPELTFISASTTNGTYTVDGDWNLTTLTSGATDTLFLRAEVREGTSGSTITNTATLVAVDNQDVNPGNDVGTVDITVRPTVDVGIKKSVLQFFALEGDTLTYIVQASNLGGVDVDSLNVSDILEPTLTHVGSSATNGAYDPVSGEWALTNLSAGAPDSLIIFAEVGPGTAGTVIDNEAGVLFSSEADPDDTNDRDFVSTLIVEAVDLLVAKTVSSSTYAVGDTVSYSIEIENLSTVDATSVVLEDIVPDELTYDSDSVDQGSYDPVLGLWDVGTVFAGDTVSFDLDAIVNSGEEGSTVLNTARVISLDQFDPNATNDVDVAVCSILLPGSGTADLGVGLSLITPEPIREGDPFTVQIALSNGGPDDATNIELRNAVPVGTTFVSASSGGYDPVTGVWTLGTVSSLSAGFLELTFQTLAGTGDDVVVDFVSVQGLDQTDPDATNDSDFVSFTVRAATDFAITKRVDVAAPAVGDTVQYVVGIENVGSTDGTDVVVQDLLPPELSFLSATASAGFYEPTSGFWFIGNVNAGVVDSLLISAQIRDDNEGVAVSNTATFFSADQLDTNGANDAASAPFTIRNTVDFVVSATSDITNGSVGDPVRFGVDVTNGASIDATAVRVHVDVPAGVLIDTITPGAGTFDDVTGFWDIPLLAAGNNLFLQLEGDILPAAEGTVMTFSGRIDSALEEIIGTEDDADTVMVTVGFVPDVAVDKTADRSSALAGDEIVYTIRSTNAGGMDLTGIVLQDPPPVQLTYVSHSVSQGAFDPVSGTWVVGSQTVAEADSVMVTMRVNPGANGSTITNTVSLTAVSEGDAVPGNDVASANVVVDETVDIVVDKSVSEPAASVGEVITFTIASGNVGSIDATNVVITDLLPTELQFVGASFTSGGYDDVSGLWTVPSMSVGVIDTLWIDATPLDGYQGAIVVNTASVTSVDQVDRESANDSDSAAIMVDETLDLAVTIGADDLSPKVGDPVQFTVTLTNLGPADATNISARVTHTGGLDLVSGTSDAGAFSSSDGRWLIDFLANTATATLTVNAIVTGAGGMTIDVDQSIESVDQVDVNPVNDTARTTLNVAASLTVSTLQQPTSGVLPGAARNDLLFLRITNDTADPETLNTLTFDNIAAGPGSQAELDASWSILALQLFDRGEYIPLESEDATPTGRGAPAIFSGGSATFDDLSEKISPGEGIEIVLTGVVSTVARDGDQLNVAIAEDGVRFASGIIPDGDFPMNRGGAIVVNGMSADQVLVHTENLSPTLNSSSTDDLALDVTLPANGYMSDTLAGIAVANLRFATENAITRMRAWEDDGDGAFDPLADTALGDFAWTGDRWALTGLSLAVPPGGRRVFVSIDLGDDADGQVRLGVVDVAMTSNNDGPLDRVVESVVTQAISTADRVRFDWVPIAAETVVPGQDDVVLLHITAQNWYSVERELTGVRVTDVGTDAAGATPAERDAIITQLRLREDTNGNGVLDGVDEDLVIGDGSFVGGICQFSGLAGITLASEEIRHFFVVGDVSLTGAADGDGLAIEVASGLDVTFAEATATAATWPLESGSEQVVDGMAAAQITVDPIAPVTLGGGDGPALALDFWLPANGYADDILNGVELENFGTADESDIDELRLYRDGGDGEFAGASPDDVDLGPLTHASGRWRSSLLTEAVSASGAHLFVGLTVSTTPTDSATVRLGLPAFGVTMGSSNDGPIDVPVTSATDLLLSSAPLSQAFIIDSDRSTEGQDITVRMSVGNGGTETITGIEPSTITPDGDGAVTLLSGPTPATFDLAPEEVQEFTWVFRADTAGTLRWIGDAGGTGQVSGLDRRTLPTASNEHTIFVPASSVDLFPTANMPFSINRDQDGVVPLTFTFRNPGTETTAGVELRVIRVRIEDELEAGIAPADLFDHVVLSEGADVYVDRTSLEPTGSTMELTLDTPLVIRSGESATLGLRLDILPTTVVENFRVVLPDETHVEAIDEISGIPVSLVLQSDDGFPVESGLGILVGGSDGLVMTGEPDSIQPSSVGQNAVELMRVTLENQSGEGQISGVEVGELAVRFVDAAGIEVADPSLLFESIWVVANSQVRAEASLASLIETPLVTLPFSLPVIVPADTPIELEFYADFHEDAVPVDLRFEIFDSGLVSARDETSGEDVLVTFAGGTIVSRLHRLQHAATVVRVESTPLFPANLVIGAQNAGSIAADVRHPGTTQTADLRLDGVRVRCVDESGQLIDGGDILDGLRIFWNDVLVADVGDPGSGEEYDVNAGGIILAAGTTGTLRVDVDVEPTAPAARFELLIDDAGMTVADANSDAPLAVLGESGFLLPLRSGVARLTLPADELVVAFDDTAPPVIAPSATEVSVATFQLNNTADAGGTPIEVESLCIRARDISGAATAIGGVIDSAVLYVDGTALATVAGLVSADDLAVFSFSPVMSVDANEALEVDLRVVPDATSAEIGFSIGIDEADVVVNQPGGALLEISVEAETGSSFPLYTRAMTFTARNLEDSYSNFPNPFPAGRGSTRFVYFLDGAGSVSLVVYTARGDRVVTLVDGRRLDAGLHQDVLWDGRNGSGSTVRNGVYVAEIDVRYEDGRRARERRKIAVVR